MFVHAGPREPVIAEGKRRVVPFWHERGRMTAAEAEGPARELPNARPSARLDEWLGYGFQALGAHIFSRNGLPPLKLFSLGALCGVAASKAAERAALADVSAAIVVVRPQGS